MSDALPRARAAAARLKVFPLPSAVLFPASMMPLHIFEPRYCEMIRDAIGSDRIFALGGLEPGWEADYAGRPPLSELCCVGQLAWHEEVDEGRFNILLHGISRARILSELPPDHLYREVQVELLPDAPYDGPEVETVRNAVLELASHLPQQPAQALVQQVSHAKGGELADLVAAAVVGPVERRRVLLRTFDVKARLQAVLGEISEVLARARGTRPTGPLN